MVNLGQSALPLEGVLEAKPVTAGISFVDDDPRTLFIGGKRLDVLLQEKGFGWVVEVRRMMERLEYTLLTAGYTGRGRRPYHPRTVLSLIFFGIMMRQFTLRDLEDLSAMHLGAWWLCGGNVIDHSTIGKFIVHHDEMLGDGFFVQLTKTLLKQLKIQPGVIGIDGTVMEAASSRFAALRAEAVALLAKEAQEQASREPQDTQAQNALEQSGALVKVVEERTVARKEQRKDTRTVTVVSTEPEAVIQPRKDGAMRPGYKLTTVVHEAGFVLGQHVHPSSESEAVEPLLEQHRRVFDGQNPSTCLADAGFFTVEVLREAVEQEIDLLCPAGQTFDASGYCERKSETDLYPKTRFRYDESQDLYVCPAGEALTFQTTGSERHLRYRLYGTRACSTCALRPQCTRGARGRRIKRYEGEEYKEAMREVLTNPRARRVYRRRMAISEPAFAWLREGLGVRRFRRRGLRRVRAEAGLYAMALNLKRALVHPGWIDVPYEVIRAFSRLLLRSRTLLLSAFHLRGDGPFAANLGRSVAIAPSGIS